ncbi:hypothetical protein JCM21714_3262 [Gracilibacillus boraciitolerans JCM 21714]|uniref:Uncharacterized protein n=2 Tax=Gracilibacillus boraciitolerans TaxID=307521 RepID=W4VMQ1_9BACI|nr:hypothetical protein JCM21714_3262 [Gracilibacillus boraciitolerans JCM 21714]
MRTDYKQNRNAATNHFNTQKIHQFNEFQSREYQTEIAASFDIALHSTQKVTKNKKQT